ncbi:MAG: hypothetical protein FIA94_09505 [Nitrospirae bacterium]|nr:hypothetical protein [Nitrospirota bacterium]
MNLELPVSLSLSFGLGVVTRSLLMLDARVLRKNILGIAVCFTALPVLVIIGMGKMPDLPLSAHIFFAFAGYCALFAVLMKNAILPQTNERSLLFLNIALWYAFITYRPMIPEFLKPVLLLIFIPLTIATLVIAFRDFILGFWLSLVFYVWYLIIIVFIGIVQFPFWNLSFFFGRAVWAPLDAADVFLSGALFSYLAVHATYILALIPLPSRHQSFAERLEEVNQHAEMLVYRYSDEQLRVREAVLLISLFGGLYCLNYVFRLMPPSALINLTIVFSPLMLVYVGRIFERLAAGDDIETAQPVDANDALTMRSEPAGFRDMYAAALSLVSSGRGKRELKEALNNTAALSIPVGKEDVPLVSHIAGWFAWVGMKDQARTLFLRILSVAPYHFLAAALCFRYALETGVRSTVRKYGILLVNADYTSHLRQVGNEKEKNLLRVMASREEMIFTYRNAADALSGMGSFREAAKARQIVDALRKGPQEAGQISS